MMYWSSGLTRGRLCMKVYADLCVGRSREYCKTPWPPRPPSSYRTISAEISRERAGRESFAESLLSAPGRRSGPNRRALGRFRLIRSGDCQWQWLGVASVLRGAWHSCTVFACWRQRAGVLLLRQWRDVEALAGSFCKWNLARVQL